MLCCDNEAGPFSSCVSIQLELEEIEAHEGDYCETRAFLTFMDAILDVPIPPQLGHAHRTTPGFAPYLCFLVDSVFMKFEARTYSDPAEKVSYSETSLCCTQRFGR